MAVKKKIVIVGGGIIGSCLAHALVEAGQDVTLLEQHDIASGTSGATFSWVNSYNKSPQPYAELNFRGLQAHEQWQKDYGGSLRWFHQIGNLHVAQNDEELEALHTKSKHHNEKGLYCSKIVSTGEIQQLEPELDISTIVGGLLFEREGWVDAPLMCRELLTRAQASGLTLVRGAKVVELSGRRVTHSDGQKLTTLEADVIVLAAGNGIKELMQQQGLDFPTQEIGYQSTSDSGAVVENPAVGLLSTSSPIAIPPRIMLRARGLVLRPAPNGGVCVVDHPTAGMWRREDSELWQVPSTIFTRAQQLYPSLRSAYIESARIGIRVLPNDGLTAMGWLPGNEHVYAVATHSGATLAPYLATSISNEICKGEKDRATEFFSLNRF